MSILLGTIVAKISRLLFLFRGRWQDGYCTMYGGLYFSFMMLSLRLRTKVALVLFWVGLFESPCCLLQLPEQRTD